MQKYITVLRMVVIQVVPTARRQCAGRLSRRARGATAIHSSPSSASLAFHCTKLQPPTTKTHKPLQPVSRSSRRHGLILAAMHPCASYRRSSPAGGTHLAPQHMLYMLLLAWYPPGAQAPGAACYGSAGENDGPRGARTSSLLAHIHDYASEDPVEEPQKHMHCLVQAGSAPILCLVPFDPLCSSCCCSLKRSNVARPSARLSPQPA